MNSGAILALADGRTFRGRAFGAQTTSGGEVVFNTGMTGYQEILTDPSYRRQIVCLTYPHIGNYGINPADVQSSQVHAAGLIVREVEASPSNWRSTSSLDAYLREARIPGISDIDTRALTRHLRSAGVVNGVIGPAELGEKRLVERARQVAPMAGMNLVDEVTCSQVHAWTKGSYRLPDVNGDKVSKNHAPRRKVVVFDYGVKRGILEQLVDASFDVTVVPAKTSAMDALKLGPDGILLSNGPGDPAAVSYAVDTIRALLGKKPIFGICLGHQLLALALGMKTYKLKFGHRGSNHPVKDKLSGRISITSQNHGFAVDLASGDGKTEVSECSLYDGTVEGLWRGDVAAFSVQYHPEAGPGPHDAADAFLRFKELVSR